MDKTAFSSLRSHSAEKEIPKMDGESLFYGLEFCNEPERIRELKGLKLLGTPTPIAAGRSKANYTRHSLFPGIVSGTQSYDTSVLAGCDNRSVKFPRVCWAKADGR